MVQSVIGCTGCSTASAMQRVSLHVSEHVCKVCMWTCVSNVLLLGSRSTMMLTTLFRCTLCHRCVISLPMSFSSDSISLAAASSASVEKPDRPQPKLWKKMTTRIGNLSGYVMQKLQPKRRLSPVQATMTLAVACVYISFLSFLLLHVVIWWQGSSSCKQRVQEMLTCRHQEACKQWWGHQGLQRLLKQATISQQILRGVHRLMMGQHLNKRCLKAE